MKIAVVQLQSDESKSENLARIDVAVSRAAGEGAQLVVLPEFAMYNLATPDESFLTAAEPLTGPFVTGLQMLARRHGVSIVAGMLEATDGDPRPYNTLVAVSGEGDVIATYRKVHLYNAFGARESDLIRPSEDAAPIVFPVAGMLVGLHTCYDLRFPESSRQLAEAGADLLVLPASWAPGARKEMHWNVLARARAIENTVYFAAVSQAPPVSTGGSLVVDPMGTIVAELGENPGLVTVALDPARVAAVRARNPSLDDRRFSMADGRWRPPVRA